MYNSQAAMATSIGFNVFSLSFGATYAGMTEDQLSTILGTLQRSEVSGLAGVRLTSRCKMFLCDG